MSKDDLKAPPQLRVTGRETVLETEFRRIHYRRSNGRSQSSRRPANLVGLSLSGGGIRSSMFCLGALQALAGYDALRKVDYLSTVSGGGYIGASLVANSGEGFPFSKSGQNLRDSAMMAHLRDNSRYLYPGGITDLFGSLAVLLRGLVVNAVLILTVIFLLAALTIVANPTEAHLGRSIILDLYLASDPGRVPADHGLLASRFLLSAVTAMLLIAVLAAWGVYHSVLVQIGQTLFRFYSMMTMGMMAPSLNSRLERKERRKRKADHRTGWSAVAVWLLFALVVFFVLELQTLLIEWMIEYYRSQWTPASTTLAGSLAGLLSVAAALASFRNRLVATIEAAISSPSLRKSIQAFLARLVLYAGALIVPGLLYFSYLLITAAGISFKVACPRLKIIEAIAAWLGFAPSALCPRLPGAPPNYPLLPDWLSASITPAAIFFAAAFLLANMLAFFALFPAKRGGGFRKRFCSKFVVDGAAAYRRALVFLIALAATIVIAVVLRQGLDAAYWHVLGSYLLIALGLASIGWFFEDNANSLHGLYRDRLNGAFRLGRQMDKDRTLTLARLDVRNAPYLLVNATLNARRSEAPDLEENQPLPQGHIVDPVKRGRNADFFVFTRDYYGAESTGYALTERDGKDCGLDLATAVAISGAAVSSSSGRIGHGILSPTLAFLNLRLGYWLDNPRYARLGANQIRRSWADVFRLYLLQEALGQLHTESPKVLLSDGGHIDNLGLYQLLKRRCRLIVVIDAEADPMLDFSALADAERFARIDLGHRIAIDWEPIRDQGRRRQQALESNTPLETGPHDHVRHFAIGKISYSPDEVGGKTIPASEGILIYVKANMTGDEPDYVRDYERRNRTFPHETTADQLFSEEQMEAYRALGFHSMSRALSRNCMRHDAARWSIVGEARRLLGIAADREL